MDPFKTPLLDLAFPKNAAYPRRKILIAIFTLVLKLYHAQQKL